MTDLTGLLAAYDEQLRTDAETPSAIAVSRQGPLYLVTFRVAAVSSPIKTSPAQTPTRSVD